MKVEIINYLNEKLGSNYKSTSKKAQSLINARVEEGATLQDFEKCIDNKIASWKGTPMEQYIRVDTLFSYKFWGYVNEKQTNLVEVGDRNDLIKAVLKASGMRDITLGDITIYNEVLKLIPTKELPQFAVSLIRSGGEFMRPDQMISKAVKEFEHKIITSNMQIGKKISDFEKFKEFMQYSFRNKIICNNLKGIYKPFVTIGMDRDGYLVNQFIWKKVSSESEQQVYKWLFENQDRIGTIQHIEIKEEVKQIEAEPTGDKERLNKTMERVRIKR